MLTDASATTPATLARMRNSAAFAAPCVPLPVAGALGVPGIHALTSPAGFATVWALTYRFPAVMAAKKSAIVFPCIGPTRFAAVIVPLTLMLLTPGAATGP